MNEKSVSFVEFLKSHIVVHRDRLRCEIRMIRIRIRMIRMIIDHIVERGNDAVVAVATELWKILRGLVIFKPLKAQAALLLLHLQ